jgi:hypothetical protein
MRNAEQGVRNELALSPHISDQRASADNRRSDSAYNDEDETTGYSNGSHNDRMLQHNGGISAEGEDHADSEVDDVLDDDMMDKISSSPSIDDGGCLSSIVWLPHDLTSNSMETLERDVKSSLILQFLSLLLLLLHKTLSRQEITVKAIIWPFAMKLRCSRPSTTNGSSGGQFSQSQLGVFANLRRYLNEMEMVIQRLSCMVFTVFSILQAILSTIITEVFLEIFLAVLVQIALTLKSLNNHRESSDECQESLDQLCRPDPSNYDRDDENDTSFCNDLDSTVSCFGANCLQKTEDIDFEFVYALHTFVATVEGQANATKGDTMVLLDDSNSYWWLVRVVKDGSIGRS